MDFIKKPLYLSTVNPRKKNNINTYYCLGDIPKNVLIAAQNGVFKNNCMEWNASDVKILKDFYGKGWKELLSGDSKPPDNLYMSMDIYKAVIGGEENLFDTYLTKGLETDNLQLSANSKILYSNLSIFPEDTLYDLRFKIQLLTKIPIARQFIFYYSDQQGPYYPYQVYMDKILYKIQWDKMIQETDININDVGIDIYFEQHKNDISHLSYDKIIMMELKNIYRINRVYIIDLLDVINTTQTLDKYQFNLLYYGFIIKYWPQLTPETFNLLISDYNKLESEYPSICLDYNTLYQKQLIEQNVLNKVYRYYDTKTYNMSITSTVIINYPKIIKLTVNIRNLFDLYVLDSNVYLSCINIKNKYNIVKKHVSVLNKELDIVYLKNAISFHVNSTKSLILTIFDNGKYTIELRWNEEDYITFDNIIESTKSIINPILSNINKLGNHVFPIGGSLNLLKNDDVIFSTTTLSIYYPCILSIQEFSKFISEFKTYESLGYIKIYQVQFAKVFNFVFYRGIVDINYPYDGYKWLYEDISNTGRKIRIIHRSDRLQIELNSVKNVNEYSIIKKYIFSIIDTFIKNNKIKREKKTVELNTKPIKRLHDLDPDLYNLLKYDDNARNYSILCQSNRQPIIYDDDIKNNKLVKYWNFTYNKPAYYSCPAKYPYLNFIINKHPKGYCLPCCKKLKDIPNTHVSDINTECFKNKKYTDEYIRYDYILSYGKKLYTGRKTYVPDIVKNINSDFIIYGVEQYDEYTDTNVGFVHSLLFLLGENCIKILADFVKNFEQYYSLANGKASVFHSSEDLYNQMCDNFIHKTNILLTNVSMTLWTDILIDLVKYKYDVDTVIIENFSLYLHIINMNVNKCIFLFIDDNGTNPIIDKKETKIFNKSDYKSIFNVKYAHIMTLSFIIQFAQKYHRIIDKLYVNLKNLCYAVSIKDYISYLPIIESPIVNQIPLSYDIRPEPDITRANLLQIIDTINDFKSSIVINNNVMLNDKCIGVKSLDNLIYFHIPESNEIYNKYDILPYDPRDIDKAIMSRTIITDMTHLGLQQKLENNLYHIFLSEFVSVIKNDSNDIIRDQMDNILKNVDLTDGRSISMMKDQLYEILKDYQIDLIAIQDFIDFSYYNSIDISNLTKFIRNSKFEFDYQTLSKLKRITDQDKLKNKLKVLMSPYISTTKTIIPTHFNIFTSCLEDNSQFFCDRHKIAISEKYIEDLYDVLVNDIMNQSKTHIIMASISGIFDYFDFIKRPFESIEIFDFIR